MDTLGVIVLVAGGVSAWRIARAVVQARETARLGRLRREAEARRAQWRRAATDPNELLTPWWAAMERAEQDLR